MDPLGALTHADFEPLAGDPFAVAEPAVALTLASVRVHPHAGPARDAFSLFFHGPAEPLLPQRIYRLEHAGLGALEIFIVPVGRTATGYEYEAVFS